MDLMTSVLVVQVLKLSPGFWFLLLRQKNTQNHTKHNLLEPRKINKQFFMLNKRKIIIIYELLLQKSIRFVKTIFSIALFGHARTPNEVFPR